MVSHSKPATGKAAALGSAAKRLPAFKKSGRMEDDDKIEGDFHMMQSIVDDMYADRGHILHVYTFLSKRKAKLSEMSEIASQSPAFESLTSMSSLEDDFKIQWITATSDLSAKDIINAMRVDPQSLDKLLFFALQLPPKARLPSCLITKEVMKLWWDKRHLACGSRLSKFKAQGGVSKGGAFDFGRNGSYTLSFTKTGELDSIRHWSGAIVQVDSICGVTNKWNLVGNFDDFGSHVIVGKMPPVKLATFFENSEGPHSVTNYVGKPKVLVSEATEVFTRWESEKRAGLASVTPSDQIRQALDDHKKAKAQACMERARKAACEAVKAKAQRMTIKLVKA